MALRKTRTFPTNRFSITASTYCRLHEIIPPLKLTASDTVSVARYKIASYDVLSRYLKHEQSYLWRPIFSNKDNDSIRPQSNKRWCELNVSRMQFRFSVMNFPNNLKSAHIHIVAEISHDMHTFSMN